jgi:hypothetical protein
MREAKAGGVGSSHRIMLTPTRSPSAITLPLWGRDKGQNKKYLCAIGSTSAGAQVSNSPSALTS